MTEAEKKYYDEPRDKNDPGDWKNYCGYEHCRRWLNDNDRCPDQHCHDRGLH